MESIKSFINDINNKKLRNHDRTKIYVVTSKENHEKLKQNKIEYDKAKITILKLDKANQQKEKSLREDTKGRKRKYEKKDDPKEKKEQTALPVQNGARKENTEDFHHEIQEQQAYRKPAENKICEVYQKGSHVVRRRDGGGASFPRHTGTGGRRDRAIP